MNKKVFISLKKRATFHIQQQQQKWFGLITGVLGSDNKDLVKGTKRATHGPHQIV